MAGPALARPSGSAATAVRSQGGGAVGGDGSVAVDVVTGAARGIGRRLAGRLAERGERVVAVDVDGERLESAFADGEGILTRRADVRVADDWRALLAEVEERFGRVDRLFNVAGVVRPGFLDELGVDDIEAMIDVNVKGVVLGTRLAVERMAERGSGHVVNVASLAGVAPIPGLAVYSATKFAVRGFTLAAAAELAPRGIALTVVCPDLVDTRMLDQQLPHAASALSFSGPRPLTVDEVAAALERAIDRRPREILLPAGRGRLARLAAFAPRLHRLLTPWLTRRGERERRRRLAARESGGRTRS